VPALVVGDRLEMRGVLVRLDRARAGFVSLWSQLLLERRQKRNLLFRVEECVGVARLGRFGGSLLQLPAAVAELDGELVLESGGSEDGVEDLFVELPDLRVELGGGGIDLIGLPTQRDRLVDVVPLELELPRLFFEGSGLVGPLRDRALLGRDVFADRRRASAELLGPVAASRRSGVGCDGHRVGVGLAFAEVHADDGRCESGRARVRGSWPPSARTRAGRACSVVTPRQKPWPRATTAWGRAFVAACTGPHAARL